MCGDTTTTLHVHHKYYEKGNEPWEYRDDALITFCCHCHESEQNEFTQYLSLFEEVFKKSEFFADDIRELCCGIKDIKLLYNHRKVMEAYAYAFADPEKQKELVEWLAERRRKNGKASA